MRRFHAVTWIVLALAAVSPALAEEPLGQELKSRFSGPEIVEKLKGGGYVLLMRHMATTREPDQWSGVELDDCSTQRILSSVGQAQARQFGEALRELEIPVGDVKTSPYCRTRETATLAFGEEPEVAPVLTTWDDLPVDEKTKRATELRHLLDTPPPAGTNRVLVTHTGNLLWTLGLESKPEGLAHVFKPTGLSIARPAYLGRVEPQEWRGLAGLPELKPDVAGEPPMEKPRTEAAPSGEAEHAAPATEAKN